MSEPEAMRGAVNLTRRRMLIGGGLTIGFVWLGFGGRKARALGAPGQPMPAGIRTAVGVPADGYAPNAFIAIDPDGSIRMVMPNIEMGQGAYTGETMLMAEELGVEPDQVTIEHAPPDDSLYASPALGGQITGGSTTIRVTWKTLREAGAVARTQLVAAAAAQWKVDPVSCTVARAVVTHPATGRTATFGSLCVAAAKLPMPAADSIKLKDPSTFTLIGKPVQRVDTPDKVNGVAKFGIDASTPGMKFVTVSGCPTLGGKLVSVDDTRARKVPGFIEVIKLPDAVAVAGDHFWAAKQGLEALDVVWDLGPNAKVDNKQIYDELADASQHGTPILGREVGDIKGKTGKTVSSTYQLPMLAHAPMEPLNALVSVTADHCEIWVGTQVPVRVVEQAARITGLPKDKITLHNHYLGGGFGRRLETDSVEQAIEIAKRVKYPIKMVWTREQDIRHDIFRPAYYDRISATLDSDGRPVAWTDRVTSGTVIGRWMPMGLTKAGLDADTVECAIEPPYEIPNLRVDWIRHDMPVGMPVGWWRGVGPTHNLFVVESFVSELALAAGKDPVAYRRMLVGDKNPRVLGVLERAASVFGWTEQKPADRNGNRVGRGVSLGTPFGSFLCAMVEVEVTPQGEVQMKRAVLAIDCGIAINPNSVEAQVQGGLIFGWTAALYGKLTFKDGAIQESNFNDYRMMRINETPDIKVEIIHSMESPGGLGETGTAMAAPCLMNAIADATGVRLYEYPIDRNKLRSGEDALKQVTASVQGVDTARVPT